MMAMIEWLADGIWWIFAIVLTSLIFAGLGYYTASTDLEEEKRKAAQKAWDEGYRAADLSQNPYNKGARR